MTRRFIMKMDKLKDLLNDMGVLVQQQLAEVISALFDDNHELAQAVLNNDKQVDEYEITIDRTCEEIMALSQPVASDLRLLVSGLKMSTDLERMGDQSANIAKQVLESEAIPGDVLRSFRIDVMTDFAKGMVADALDAFTHGDGAEAKSVCDRDDEVDEINLHVIETMSKNSLVDLSPAQRINLLIISQNIERIGDLATNIAEEVIFLVHAKIIKHNYQEFTE